jgi:hypothetical protein
MDFPKKKGNNKQADKRDHEEEESSHSGHSQLSIKDKESDKQIVKLSTGIGKLEAEGIFPRRKETSRQKRP